MTAENAENIVNAHSVPGRATLGEAAPAWSRAVTPPNE